MVVETPGGNIVRFMHSVLTGYTVSYNLRHNRSGHLTQGRYGARLVAGDEYLLKLSRYVHLNPVKVKSKTGRSISELRTYLREYKWSSYRSYIGLAKRLEWVDYGPMLALAGGKREGQTDRYMTYVEAGIAEKDEEFGKAMRLSPRSIGDDEFREMVDERHAALLRKRKHPEDVALREKEVKRPDPGVVMEAVARAAGTTVEGLKECRRGWIWRGIAAILLVKESGLTRRKCAVLLGLRQGSGVGYQIKKAEEHLKSDLRMAQAVARLEAQLKTAK